jgi:WD repeat-containing protein 61
MKEQNIPVQKVHTLLGHEGSVYTLEKSSSPDKFFSGSSDRYVAEWTVGKDETPKALVSVGAIIYALKYVAEKNLLLIGTSSGALHIVDLISRKEIKYIIHHRLAIFDIQYSILHDQFYTAGGEGSIAVWSLDDFSLLHSIPLCKEKVRGLALNNAEEVLAVACGDGSIRLFHTSSMKEFETVIAHTSSVNCVLFHPEKKFLISGGRDAHLNIWSTESFSLYKSIPAHNYAIYSISFSSDKKHFATASRDKTVKIWNAETFEVLLRLDKEKFQGHLNSVNKVLWMENGILLSCGDDRSILAWET